MAIKPRCSPMFFLQCAREAVIADTMDEAEELADFIETDNLLNGDGNANGIIQAFWNP